MMLFAQPLRPRGIVFDLIRMRITIDFNHQFGFGAEEIDDVGIDSMLFSAPGGPPALCAGHGQLRAIELPVAQILP